MASGDHSAAVAIAPEDLPMGSVITSSGRISGVHRVGEPFTDDLPFETKDLVALDVALTEATRATKVRFNAYIGDLGANPAAGADALFPTTPEAERSVLIAVSPNQRVVEVRSGRVIADRVTDRVAQLGATAAVSSFSEGNLIDGLISAIRVMSAAISAP
ncbi:DUF5130 domain-containing protein [Rhodococcus sp. SRB_17]|uniref:DUF5130 domain-containing protein n=1 Tax=Rhodococcus sp. OK302 TaxID=1882769 RepID=UPI000B943553|nr:DUF5130 domain-containing protein [Rhodococcus sp. OK302]NMM87452.1 DUF5130 domain-containing protein [Rhodococcus sp. SRB_17]OYD71178.1 uncharacterized protein DUF5130 [Rhodococcus sp. OK302]